jgi:agmatine deiminase
MKATDCSRRSLACAKMRMPAEWEPQEATWLAWPHNKEDWPDKFEPIPWVYAEIIRYITHCQRVRLIVKNAREQAAATTILERANIKLDAIDFLQMPTDRVWTRDSGPTFVYRNNERVLLDWRFNAWAKYDNWQHDDKVPARIAKYLDLPIIQPTTIINGKKTRVVLEGGAIEVNGKGTMLVTEECLLSKTQCRNPGLTRDAYEKVFAEYLGISNVIWLKDGIVGDDTHGHIDDLARFVNANTVVIASEKNKRDPNFSILRENIKRLKVARDQNGKQLNVVELPMPQAVIFEKQRLPASYANFLITNMYILVPIFDDPNDRIALNILAELFPKHSITGIYCGDFVWGLGTIHCASQQECISKF